MLQKSIIALSTVFALSACGGSLDLGPGTPPPDNGNGENGNGNGNGNGEPGESQIWTYMNFSEEEDVTSWAHRCIEGCDATAELSWNGDEEVLVVMPEWASDEDHLEIYTPIDEIGNMNGANASAWVYVTEEYVNDGNVTMQMVLTAANGAKAHTKPVAPEQVGWNRVSAWEMQSGTAEEHEEEDMQGIDYGTFYWHDDNFVLTDINEFGVLFASNGKEVEVGGPLWIDNVLLTPGSDFSPVLVDITEGWFSKPSADGADVADVEYGDGFVSLYVVEPGQQLVTPVHGPGSYGGAELIFTISLDEEYLDNADGFQPFGQVFNDTDEGYMDDEEVDGEWDCWTGHGNVPGPDEEFDVTCVLNDEELFELGEDQYMLVGMQSQTDNAQGTMRIHRVEIAGASTPAPGGEPIEVSMDAGWRVSPEALEWDYTDDGVQFQPTAANDQLVFDPEGPLNLKDAVITFVYEVDEDFINSGANLQPFAQLKDYGDWDYHFCWIGNGELEEGEQTFECTIPAELDENETPAEVPEGEEAQIGIQTNGGGAGTVTIKSVTIVPGS